MRHTAHYRLLLTFVAIFWASTGVAQTPVIESGCTYVVGGPPSARTPTRRNRIPASQWK